jgi:hypothetical protein
MSYYLRPERDEIGRVHWDAPGVPFVAAAPLALHDACADRLGIGGHPWDPGRESFGELAGQPLCWSPGPYSIPAHVPCYGCGKAV